MNATPAISLAERRRLDHLAADVPANRWIVLAADPEGELAAAAAAAGRAPVLAATGSNPVPALRRVHAAGMRLRVHLTAADPIAAAASWSRPVGLLVVSARALALRALVAAWGRHVDAGGRILFIGGLAPPPTALGLRGDHWRAHLRGEGLFLLTRRPFG